MANIFLRSSLATHHWKHFSKLLTSDDCIHKRQSHHLHYIGNDLSRVHRISELLVLLIPVEMARPVSKYWYSLSPQS